MRQTRGYECFIFCVMMNVISVYVTVYIRVASGLAQVENIAPDPPSQLMVQTKTASSLNIWPLQCEIAPLPFSPEA